MFDWLNARLQTWTPLSVLAIMVGGVIAFVFIWDSIHSIDIPAYVYALLSVLFGGAGATGLISHGVTQANGTATATATAIVEAQNKVQQPTPPPTQVN